MKEAHIQPPQIYAVSNYLREAGIKIGTKGYNRYMFELQAISEEGDNE